MIKNEIALLLEIRPLFPDGGVDCHSWLPVGLEGGAVLDCCAICGGSRAEHDDVDDDDED